jgi:hypothetical protein
MGDRGYFSPAFFGSISSCIFVPSGFTQNTLAEDILSFVIPSLARLKVVVADFCVKMYFALIIMLFPSILTFGFTEPIEAALLGGRAKIISGQLIRTVGLVEKSLRGTLIVLPLGTRTQPVVRTTNIVAAHAQLGMLTFINKYQFPKTPDPNFAADGKGFPCQLTEVQGYLKKRSPAISQK